MRPRPRWILLVLGLLPLLALASPHVPPPRRR